MYRGILNFGIFQADFSHDKKNLSRFYLFSIKDVVIISHAKI